VIVVDTNILVYHWLRNPRTPDTNDLLRRDPEWAAPGLWRSEFRNVLAGYLRRGAIDNLSAEMAINFAAACLLAGEHQVQDSVVFNLLGRSDCTSYDCEFVALALALDTYLVTEDRALLRNFPQLCRSLSEAIGGNIS
jgi:predicted nucleic acid-binding protein